MYPDHVVDRFWGNVGICTHGFACAQCCWPWEGHLTRAYGDFFIPKAYRHGKSKQERATRVCWRIIHGPIPHGLHILHTCDNPPCVNPAHLWAGTIDDNQKDSMHKGRRPTGDRHGLRLHPDAASRGDTHHASKLTSSDIPMIRLLSEQGWSHARIARSYGCSRTAIQAMLAGRTWKHVP